VSALGLASRVADERMEDLDQGAQSVVSPLVVAIIYPCSRRVAGLHHSWRVKDWTKHSDLVCHYRCDSSSLVGRRRRRSRWHLAYRCGRGTYRVLGRVRVADGVFQVHERSVDSDFLLLQLRELLQRNKSIKVSYVGCRSLD
jgi:hypothetical protein